MKKITVLIVDDSAFMRKLLKDFLTEDPNILIVGTARNGADAIKKVKELKPDVVTLDVEMPIMDGIDALKVMMEECPTAVIMLSSTTQEGTESTLAAMQLGAFDFIAKPSGAISLDLHKIKSELISKVLCAGTANIAKLHMPQNDCERKPAVVESSSETVQQKFLTHKHIPYKTGSEKKLIVIGTSTGGPRALQTVLSMLPASINAPILVVQHMPPGFTKSLSQRLDTLSAIQVKEAEDGEILKKGTAYIAPGGYHLKVKKLGMSLAVSIDQTDQQNGHRPSVDTLFESVSEIENYEKIAVIMTGMGMDGANGLIQLKKTGLTMAIAESQETSIVFGMPKAAIATGCINKVVDVEQIASVINSYC
ncbi:chemotaxis response regulator protein-glutamate methylesterase [Peribacillus psychrosaccharolyticus]|uniref:Protein-glutamate methylesterase/protein-glutamine glutaminase n=2 Tax=Peribacillus psychrosaccharolyticus TaxID=1407 RepID=A0A974S1B6_PERPY|nr:chemotaxis response regulator protein-glutamate methylesterase [Peribacillus psychrosaccharolyticus]MEC2053824.1 chemotaxis response regulator protein-glutamate methylesterase [Peribacillus psychrosaccharolyticus]QQT01512.1 chemotaxis response regulator protein-glutamate methylesterase [Peribacillus psychrosaccharolyticus]